ncbi:MAG TPA: ribosome-associated translation inhibitor RaiA [Rhodopila sp.]|jgi:ribosomal subunit interface protein|nr:ribosome-associated translation inhibitor RaiA [Rhodopila sp.]
MQITVSGKQVELSDALRTRVATQLEAIASKYFDHALEAHVTFSRARSFFGCDINLHAGRGLRLRAEGEAADANVAFDGAADRLAKRLRRYRRRVNDHARDLAQRARPESARQVILQQETSETDDETPDMRTADEVFATVIAETQTELAMLSVSEAVMRMDLADQPVLMFRNSANGVLNVVYRRSDGHIGWIHPTPESQVA